MTVEMEKKNSRIVNSTTYYINWKIRRKKKCWDIEILLILDYLPPPLKFGNTFVQFIMFSYFDNCCLIFLQFHFVVLYSILRRFFFIVTVIKKILEKWAKKTYLPRPCMNRQVGTTPSDKYRNGKTSWVVNKVYYNNCKKIKMYVVFFGFSCFTWF